MPYSPVSSVDDVLVAGYDINGFSQVVDDMALCHGREAGEVAAATLLRGSEAVVEQLAQIGLTPFESSGDGLLFAGRAEAGGVNEALTAAERAHVEASGLAIRSAWTVGRLRRTDLEGLVPGQPFLFWGEPMYRLHSALAAAPRRPGEPRLTSPGFVQKWVADSDGKLQTEQCLFVRLCDGATWQSLVEHELHTFLTAIRDWCDPVGGNMERLGHDEKGIMLRLSLRSGHRLTPADFGTLADALNALGANCAVAHAEGDIFRGRLRGIAIVHGQPINQAAKRCGALDRGAVDVRNPVSSATGRDSEAVGKHLFGRDAELAEVIACFAAGTRHVVIVGDAGIGKTQLARAIWNQFRDTGAASHWIECGARHRLQPFAAVRELIRGLVRGAYSANAEIDAHVLRSIMADAGLIGDDLSIADGLWLLDSRSSPIAADGTGNQADRAVRIQKLALAIITSLVRGRATLVAVDDAHLADRYSAEVFDRLASEQPALQMLFTRRELGSGAGFQDAIAIAKVIELRPIDRTAVAHLIRCEAPAIRDADVAHILDLARGNPFAARAGAAWALLGGDAADSLADILGQRIAVLSRVDRLVLRILAIAADAISLDRIDEILRRLGQATSAADPVERLVAAGLVEHAGRSTLYRPSHELIRSAVRGEMSAGATVMAAEALARVSRFDVPADARWGAMAQQWDLARNPRRAAQCYGHGAQAAFDTGFAAAAAEMYALAIDKATSVGLAANFAVARWRSRLAEAYWAAGELAKAGQAATLAAMALRPFARSGRGKKALVRTGSILSETGYFTGRIADVLRGGSMATRYGGLQDARTLEHCRSNSTIAYAAGLLRIPVVPGILFSRAHRLAADRRDLRPEAYVRATEGILNMIFCRWSACDRQLARSMACLAEWPAERQLREVVVTAMGHSATFQGNWTAAEARFDELGRLAAERENRLHLGWSAYMLGLIHLSNGKWDAASTEIEAAHIRLKESGDVLSDHIVAGLRARLLCDIGDDTGALAMAEAAGELSLVTPPTNFSSLEGFAAPPLVGARLMDREKGISDRARQLVARYRPALRRFACLFPHARPRLATIDALLAANGRSCGAARAAQRARRCAARSGMAGELNLAETLLGPD